MEHKEKYILDNGWIAFLNFAGESFLHVLPIENNLFNKEKIVKIPMVTFTAIERGNRNIKSLAEKYNIYSNVIQWKKSSNTVNVKRANSEAVYYGRGYISKDEHGDYYLYYQLARQGGGQRKIPLSKEAYHDSRCGKYRLSDLFEKHNLYKFDNDEYNVKY